MAKFDYSWLIGAGLGFALGGPIGGIVGALLGSQVGKLKGRFPGQAAPGQRDTGYYTEGVQEGDLIISFLILSAAVTRADEKVLATEVKLLKEYLVRSFGMTRAAALMKLYKDILEREDLDIDAVLAQIREEADPGFKRTVLQVLYEIALSDQDLAKAEAEILRRFARGMGMSEAEVQGIASLYNLRAPNRDYDLLELPATAPDEEIKSRYRELVKKYHPDKVGHLGQEFRELAEKKFKEISSAYERIRKAKGF